MKKRKAPICGSRTWTAQELEYLDSNWGYVSLPSMANRLNRTVEAIKIKASRLGLGSVLMGGDYITLNQLIIALSGHKESSYLRKSWVENRGLPVHKKRVDKCWFNVVYIDEFWQWAEKHRSFIDFSKMEPLALGKEPEWVVEQRKKDYRALSLQRKDTWSPAEDSKLLYLLGQQKYGYLELSKMLNRSAGAIQHRCLDLGTKLRPVKADNHGEDSAWTDKDYQTLCAGIKNGDSYGALSELIGKSEKAIRGKVYFVYLTENMDKVRAMIGSGKWGDGAPVPTVKQGRNLSTCRTQVRKDLSYFAGLLKYRLNQLGYDPYWQRFMCSNWDDFKGCMAGETDCDSCAQFLRIREQYCCRCGATFFERKGNKFCADCRTARKKQANKKWAVLKSRGRI